MFVGRFREGGEGRGVIKKLVVFMPRVCNANLQFIMGWCVYNKQVILVCQLFYFHEHSQIVVQHSIVKPWHKRIPPISCLGPNHPSGVLFYFQPIGGMCNRHCTLSTNWQILCTG